MLFANRISETTNFNEDKILIPLVGVVSLQVLPGGEGKVWGKYSQKNKEILFWPEAAGDYIQGARAALAHEVGHAHHHWVQTHRLYIWRWWVDKIYPRLLSEGTINGYAAANPQEGWAEIYRLSLGVHFDPNRGATRGDWQFCQTRSSQALKAWNALMG